MIIIIPYLSNYRRFIGIQYKMYNNNYISIQMLNVLCINNYFALFRINLYLMYCVINYNIKVNIIKKQ